MHLAKKCVIILALSKDDAEIQLFRGYGSVGRAPRSQRGGQGFESPYLHQKMSYYFDTTFFIHYGVMVYHHATCLRAYHQKERFLSLFFAYHHALACIKLRNDDIQCSALMIFSHFVSDDIHFLRK